MKISIDITLVKSELKQKEVDTNMPVTNPDKTCSNYGRHLNIVHIKDTDNAHSFLNRKSFYKMQIDRSLIFHYFYIYNFVGSMITVSVPERIGAIKTKMFQYVTKTSVTLSITPIYNECIQPTSKASLVTKLNIVLQQSSGATHSVSQVW